MGKLYQYSSCYAKLEQHWTKCLCIHSSNDTLKLLDRNCNHQQGFVKQKLLLSIMLHNELAMLCSMMKRNISCLTNPCWWLQLQSSNFNVSLAWFLNLFSIKFWFQAYQMYKPQIGNFSEKLLRMRAPVFFQNKNFLIELLQTHTLIF